MTLLEVFIRHADGLQKWFSQTIKKEQIFLGVKLTSEFDRRRVPHTKCDIILPRLYEQIKITSTEYLI